MRALRRASRACRDAADAAAGGVTVCVDLFNYAADYVPLGSGAAPGRVLEVLGRFRDAAAIELRGAGRFDCQAGAARLLAALSRWAGAEPGGRRCWPGVARIAGCPSMCLPALAELCPNVKSVELAAWDAGGALLPEALQALPSLPRLTELRVTAGRGGDNEEGGVPRKVFVSDLVVVGELTSLRHLAVDLPLWQGYTGRIFDLCACISGLTGLTHLQLPLSAICGLSALCALSGLRSLVAGQDPFPLTALDGLPRFEHLTALECAARPIDAARLVPYTPEAPGLALARLEVPGAYLNMEQLSTLAATCPNLTRLAAMCLIALPAGGEAPVLRELRELACSFGPAFPAPLTSLAPRLVRLEMQAGEHGGTPHGFSISLEPREPFYLELVDPLHHYLRSGGSFDFINKNWALGALKLRAPLNGTDAEAHSTALQLFHACARRGGLEALWLRTDRPTLFLGMAAGTFAGSLQALHVATLPGTCPSSLIAAVCMFRCLEHVTLEEGDEDEPAVRYSNHDLTDDHLLQLEASRPESLAYVTLRRTPGVSREGADAAERRGAAWGVPLEVVMEGCW
jgi:hypothetical protein